MALQVVKKIIEETSVGAELLTDSDESGPSEVGTVTWGRKLRNRAKAVSKQVDKVDMELGKLLHEIHSGEVRGESGSQPVWKMWGFSSFPEYVEQELGIHRRKADRLRTIWYTVNVYLKDAPPDTQRRLVALGSGKLRELVRVLDRKNFDTWLGLAESSTYDQVVQHVSQALQSRRKSELEEKVERSGAIQGGSLSDIDGASFDGVPASITVQSGPSANNIDESKGNDDMNPSVKFHAPTEPVVAESVARMLFMLYPEQELNVLRALERAGQLAKSSKKGHQLDMICLDFLATNDFASGEKSELSITNYLAKLEAAMGIKLVAVHAKTLEPVYGLDTLAKMAGHE